MERDARRSIADRLARAWVELDPQPLWLPLSILGLLFVAATFLPYHGWDLHAYWSVNPASPYGGQTGALSSYGAFFYAPPIALAMAPLGWLPWPAAVAVWLALQLGALYLIGGRWALALVIFPPVWLDLTYGNINILLAGTIVLGRRYPAVWAFALLTKVSPGVGLVWFAVRREWRALGIATGTAATALAASAVIVGPGVVLEWFALLRSSAEITAPAWAWSPPLLPRVILAAAVVAWGARTDRQWTVAVGVTIAMPVLWPIAWAPLIAMLPALRSQEEAIPR